MDTQVAVSLLWAADTHSNNVCNGQREGAHQIAAHEKSTPVLRLGAPALLLNVSLPVAHRGPQHHSRLALVAIDWIMSNYDDVAMDFGDDDDGVSVVIVQSVSISRTIIGGLVGSHGQV